MATTLRELLIRVGVDANNAKASLAQVDAGVERVKTGFQNLATFAAAATAAIGAAGLGAVLLASQAAAAAKTIDLQSRALGVQVEQYQMLTQAAATFGLEQQDVAQAMVKTTLALKAGAEGGEAQAEAFKRLGLDLKATLNLKPDERLLALSDAFRQVKGDVDRLALANALFGDDLAVKLLPLLTAGSVQLRGLGEEAAKLGIILTRDNIDASLKFAKAQGEVLRVVEAVQLKIGVALSPVLTDMAERFLVWYEANKEIISQKIDEYADLVAIGLERVADALGQIDKSIGGAEGWARLAEYLIIMGGVNGAGMVAGQLYDMGGGAKDATLGLIAMIPAVINSTSAHLQSVAALHRLAIEYGVVGAARSLFMRTEEKDIGKSHLRLHDLRKTLESVYKTGQGRTVGGILGSVGLQTAVRALTMALTSAGIPMAALGASAVALKAALAGVALVAAKVAAVVGVVAGTFLIFEDVWTWLRGGDSVFGRMLEKMKESGGVLGAFARVYEALGNIANAVMSRLVWVWEGVGGMLGWVGTKVYELNAALGDIMLPYLVQIGDKIIEVGEALGIEIPDFVQTIVDALKAWRDGLVDIIDLFSIALNMAAEFIGTDAADAKMMGRGGVTDASNQQAQAVKVADNFGSLFYDDYERAQIGANAKRGAVGLGRGIGTGTDLAALGFKTTAETARSAMSAAQGFAFGPQGSDARNAALAGLSGRPVAQSPVTVSAPVTVTIQGNADERTIREMERRIRSGQEDMLRGLQNELLGAEL